MLKDNEHYEPLGKNIKVIVSDKHHFSTDTILLADFAMPKKHDKSVELGTGCGTIPLIWAREMGKNLNVTAVEIQDDAYDMIKRSVLINGLGKYIHPVHGDLRNLRSKLRYGYYDLVVSNPPYKLSGSGIVNPDKEKMLARHEEFCTLEDIVSCASRLLQFGGRFCMCQRPERLSDVIETMRKYHLEPKRLRFVQQRQNKEPKLFLIEGRRGGNRGFLQTMPVLFIEDDKGDFSEEMRRIYGCYKTGDTDSAKQEINK